jgi:dipeptidase E
MRLYLSSENVGNHADALLKMAGGNKSVAYIGNAKDGDPQERAEKVPIHKQQFEDLGFKFTEFDLRNYFRDTKISREDIEGFGVIWCSGGNTFLLRRALLDSGIDRAIIDLVNEDKIVYGGSSAGSIIPTPSLRGTEFGDDPNEVERAYNKDVIWDGLNLVPFYIVPHFESEWFGAESQAMADYFEKANLPYKALKDGQVWLVDGDKQELLP